MLRRFALNTVTLPPSIHAALVDSLFSNPAPMFFGALCSAIAAFLTAYKTGNDLLWLIAPTIVLIGAFRALQMHQYQRRPLPMEPAASAAWETKYQIGALSYGAMMGLWCWVTIFHTNDPVAHMLATTVTVANSAAGAGRTYGRPWIFHLQILISCGPMALALGLRGDPYYISLAVLNVLFFLGVRRITQILQQIYINAMLTSERETAIAAQFDTALNNMPHGLCMFNADGRLVVVNGRFSEMMRLRDDQVPRDAVVRDIVAACVGAGSLAAADAETIGAVIEGAKAAELSTIESMGSGRALEWTFQSMADGGTVVLVEDITERRNAEARINHLARFDELTGLPNRVSFQNELERDLADSQNWSRLSALLFVDLDQFKQVNDTLGHPAGDRLLCSVSARLREIMRPEDYVARFGGDEFVVFLRSIRSNEDAATIAARIVDRISETYEIDHHMVEIGASIGIAMTTPGIGPDHLLRNADMALYRAKADGRGTYCFFREELAESIEARRSLEIDLRHAMANEEFELYFQPLVNLKTGRISTCETLLRWNHPVRGSVSPAEIIPVVEDMGLIVDLGRWILRRACMECMTWPEPVNIAVNFSSQQFHRRDVLNDIRYALEVSGLAAHRLEIEITESSLLRNTPWTREVLEQLRTEGVRISLDDFGTGYSSLSYLHNFPLHKVKIDRSFLEGIDGDRPQTLLRGIARLSADLGMSVVVEGIETNEQLELISKDGTVTEAQGYLFGKPVPAAQIRPLLRASHARDTAPVVEMARAAARSIA